MCICISKNKELEGWILALECKFKEIRIKECWTAMINSMHVNELKSLKDECDELANKFNSVIEKN